MLNFVKRDFQILEKIVQANPTICRNNEEITLETVSIKMKSLLYQDCITYKKSLILMTSTFKLTECIYGLFFLLIH